VLVAAPGRTVLPPRGDPVGTGPKAEQSDTSAIRAGCYSGICFPVAATPEKL